MDTTNSAHRKNVSGFKYFITEKNRKQKIKHIMKVISLKNVKLKHWQYGFTMKCFLIVFGMLWVGHKCLNV